MPQTVHETKFNTKKSPKTEKTSKCQLGSNNDVVDWNVNELDKVPNESHDGKSNSCGNSNFLKLFPVRLGAPFYQPDGVLGELLSWLDE